jgi:hypothetical protein
VYPMNPDLAYGRSRAADRLHRAERIRLAGEARNGRAQAAQPITALVALSVDVCTDACATKAPVQAA